MSVNQSLAQERRARLAAEHLLKLKQAELSSANEKLSQHALTLSEEIVEKREEVAVVRTVAEELRGKNTQVLQDLKQANHAVNIAERRLWDSVETIEDGFAVFDADNLLIAANSAYLSVFDGMECVTAGVSYPEIIQIMVEEGIVDIEDNTPAEWCADFLWRWRSNDLEPRTIKLWNGQFIKLVDRRSQGGDTVSLALNITDMIRNEEQLKIARSKAEAANRAKSAFLAKMSHELRTPMNGVVGMADLLADSTLSEEQMLFVDTIRSSGEALLSLINDVLDFSKIEAAKLALHCEAFDLERCVHDVVMLFQPAVQTKKIDLIVDYDMFLPTGFIGDAGRLRQVLTNLIGNAVKFTTEGHVLIRVVGLPEPDSAGYRLHFTIEDTGIGIPDNMVEHIFGEFNQVEDEKNRKFEGTGLGLAITRQLIGLMGGEIWVDSEIGQGASFGFHLTMPMEEGAATEPEPLPKWIKRVALLGGQSQATSTLEKQLLIFGIEIVHASECTGDVAASEAVDLIVHDGGNNGEMDDGAIENTSRYDPGIPMVMLHSGLIKSLPRLERPVVALNKPFSYSALVAAVSQLSAPERQAAQPKQADRTMRILAAEDNKTNRLVFSKLVKNLNISLEFAENGVEAVSRWREFQPDLVFMDISMPEMDGKEATRLIRQAEKDEKLPHTPIVALTAHAMAGDGDAILAAGLDYYLTKPLRKDAIFSRIREETPDCALPVFEGDQVITSVEENKAI